MVFGDLKVNNEHIGKMVKDIEDGRYNQKELENLYNNSKTKMELVNTTDTEKQNCKIVQLAAKDALRALGNKAYKIHFIKPIREKLEELMHQITNENNWRRFDNNHVKNGVKIGGDMIRGDVVAQYYISYRKSDWKRSIYLSVTQDNEDTGVYYKVTFPDLSEEVRTFDKEEAVQLFKNYVE